MRDREPDSRPSNGEIPAGHMHLDLLGTFRLRQHGQPVAGLDHPRLQHMLAYLALHRDLPISRQQLAFLFWPESTDQQAFKNLRTVLTRLRHTLPDIDRYINITAQTIQWHADAPITVDAAEFETAVKAAEAQGVEDYIEAAKALATAVDRYTGELLPGCYDDWILPLRERFHRACGDALERLVLLLEDHRDYCSALPYALRLLNHDPLYEAAYHHLIRLHLALGDRAEALRVCRSCESMLEREFGTALASGARELYQRLIAAEELPALAALEQPLGARSSSMPFVGRDKEWSRLISAWRASAAGRPQMVLISGEAGVGKTRLGKELCAWVARKGRAVAAARCYPAGGIALAYAPVVEWLRDRAIQSRLAVLDEIWLVEIARIFPAILAGHPHLKSPGPITEAWQRTRLFEALARAVVGPDEQAPLLLFLDDLHWCDQETLDWLGYLLRFASRAPLLIVAAVRKYEIDRVHPLMAFWFNLTRSGLLSEVPLAPLDAVETGRLAASVAGRAVDASEAARIYQDTEGNPLFVVEFVQAGRTNEWTGRDRNQPAAKTGEELLGESAKDLSTSFPLLSASAAFPPKMRAVIQLRLAQLSPAARALAETAAVIGREFHSEVLARASGLDEETVIEGLEELWRRHIVRAHSGPVYDFSHDGIRAVAYDDTSPIRRQAAHLRVAQALEELHQDDLDPFCIQIAANYEQAGLAQQAITYYRRAADRAESVFAHAAAARLYQHLLESELSTDLTRLEKCVVMLALADVWGATGQWAQAESISRNALAEAEALGDNRLLARAKCALADVLHQLGYYDAALQWLAEAQTGFQAAGEHRGVASALRIAGEIHWLRGNHAQALTALERQLQIAGQMDDPHGICEAQEAIGMVLWSQGDWEQAADYCLKSIRIASPLDYKPVIARASIILGNIRSGEHWFGEAVYWYQHASELAREMDDRRSLSWAIYSIALILSKRGDSARAMAGFARSLRSAWEIGDRWTACLNVAGLAAVVEHLKSAEQAEELYRLAVDLGQSLRIPGYLSGILVRFARFLLEQERAGEARGIYEEALSQISGVAGERLAGEDIRFEAQVLGIRLRYALGESSQAEAAARVHTLLMGVDTPARQAALHDALWRLSPGDDAARTAAAGFYRVEYTESWAIECRQRYLELTGDLLPDPPPLPDVSDLIPDQRGTPDLDQILARMRSSFQ